MSQHYSFSMRSRQNLTEAMKEEAFAFAKCKVLAQQARKRGNNRLGGILEKTAEQHYLKHFEEQAELLDLLGTDQQKVSQAIVEESFLIDIICKLFAQEASKDGDKEVARLLNEMHHDEANHRIRLAEALKNLQEQKSR